MYVKKELFLVYIYTCNDVNNVVKPIVVPIKAFQDDDAKDVYAGK